MEYKGAMIQLPLIPIDRIERFLPYCFGEIKLPQEHWRPCGEAICEALRQENEKNTSVEYKRPRVSEIIQAAVLRYANNNQLSKMLTEKDMNAAFNLGTLEEARKNALGHVDLDALRREVQYCIVGYYDNIPKTDQQKIMEDIRKDILYGDVKIGDDIKPVVDRYVVDYLSKKDSTLHEGQKATPPASAHTSGQSPQ